MSQFNERDVSIWPRRVCGRKLGGRLDWKWLAGKVGIELDCPLRRCELNNSLTWILEGYFVESMLKIYWVQWEGMKMGDVPVAAEL